MLRSICIIGTRWGAAGRRPRRGEGRDGESCIYILHVYAPVYHTPMHVYAMCGVSRGPGPAAIAEVAAASMAAASLVCGLARSQRHSHKVHACHTVSIVEVKPKVRKSP